MLGNGKNEQLKALSMAVSVWGLTGLIDCCFPTGKINPAAHPPCGSSLLPPSTVPTLCAGPRYQMHWVPL